MPSLSLAVFALAALLMAISHLLLVWGHHKLESRIRQIEQRTEVKP